MRQPGAEKDTKNQHDQRRNQHSRYRCGTGRARCAGEGLSEQKSLRDILDETEQTEILRALEASNGIIAGPSGAAARLGVKRSTLQLRMQKLGIRLSRTPLADRGRMDA